MANALDDVKAAIGIHREARDQGFRAGFVIACIDLHKTHGEGALAFMLLENAGISRDSALASVEFDDYDAVNEIFDSNS